VAEIRALWRIGDSRTGLTCMPVPLILMLWKGSGRLEWRASRADRLWRAELPPL
jgi:hypothetical protein